MKTRARDARGYARYIAVHIGVAAVGLVLSTAHDAKAAGTALDILSGRCVGMAGACTAHIDTSDAVLFNPAGIARGKGLDAQIGITPIVPTFAYKDPQGKETTMPFNIVPPFQAYAAYGITDHFSAGIGLFTPYGLRIAWPDGWDGQRQLTKASLITIDINPTLAYEFLDERVRVGAGFQAVHAAVHLQRTVSFGSQDGAIDLGAGAWGWGFNAGLQADIIKKYLTFGTFYRSAVAIDFDDGQAHFDNVPTALQGTIHDQKAQTKLVNPDQLGFGLATRPTDWLLLEADAIWVAWSKFHSIDIHFPDDRTGTLDTHEPKNWTGKVHFNMGGEAAVHKNWRVRAGFLYDQTPSPESTLSPDLPDANRLNLAAGGSYWHDSGFRVDVGYQYIILFPHTSTFAAFPGEYSGSVNALAFSIGYVQPTRRTSASKPPPPEPTPEVAPEPGGSTTTSPPPGATTPGL